MHNFNYFLLTALLFLSACAPSGLSVRVDYLNHDTLASYHVNTPDPRLCCPPLGERLVISWSLSRETLDQQLTELVVNIRLRNHTSVDERLTICEPTGSFTYTLLDDNYFSCGGILAYQAQIVQGETVIDVWKHQIWTELIQFDDLEEDQEDCECIEPYNNAYEQGIDYDPATDLPPSTF